MIRPALVLLLAASLLAFAPAVPAKRTVCTITVNSTDEAQAFRKHLPPGEFDFVELVERGRPDWLATACKQQISCDILIISGHFNGNDFFSDRLEVGEFLPVAEMERVSCSASCPGLFSRLKEVYLFGCDSLNPEARRWASGEIVRSLVASGHAKGEAEHRARLLAERHGESNREVMRRVFTNVPAIYGFSSVAPLGATAGPLLHRYFQSAARSEIGSGRPQRALLSQFSPHSLTVVPGLKSTDAGARHRAEACRFVDDRLTPTQKLAFLHELMGREMAETRMFFERIERFLASLTSSERETPEYRAALERITRDGGARERYLAFAREADRPAIRARMTDVAMTLGWLSPAEHRTELVRMMRELLEGESVSVAGVEQICTMNRQHGFDAERDVVTSRNAGPRSTGHAAALACLGSRDDHARMLAALTSVNDADIQTAEVYFQHRELANATELRTVTTGIATMTRPEAQVRAIGALTRQPLAAEGLQELMRLFVESRSPIVQRAIAAVFIRADLRSLASPEFVRVLREHRQASSERGSVVDMLIRRLERGGAASGA